MLNVSEKNTVNLNQDHKQPNTISNILSASNVAHFFINKSIPNSEYAITPLKLQKLVYYAQAIFLVESKGVALFEEKIEAWDHGPVVPELYYEFRDYRYNEIHNEQKDDATKDFNPLQLSVLNDVWSIFGRYDGKHLERLTHEETPWQEAYVPSMNNEITLDSIRRYFESM